MMLLRANVLTLGFSGIRPEVMEVALRDAQLPCAPRCSGKRISRREWRSRAACAFGIERDGEGEVFFQR